MNESLANITLMNVTATNTTAEVEEEEEMCDIPEEELDMCHLQAYDTIEKQIRLGCEFVIVIWSFIYLVIAGKERSFLGGLVVKIFKKKFKPPTSSFLGTHCTSSDLGRSSRRTCSFVPREFSFSSPASSWLSASPSGPHLCLFLLSDTLNIRGRLFCLCSTEDSLAIVIMTCTGPYFLFFCRGFKLVGPMVIMVYRMLAQDIVRSFCII